MIATAAVDMIDTQSGNPQTASSAVAGAYITIPIWNDCKAAQHCEHLMI
jgi:hypothetical protein